MERHMTDLTSEDLRCSTPCHLRSSCARFMQYPDERAVGFHPDLEDGGCSMWVVRKELKTENLRNNPKLHQQFTPGTRRIRRKGGAWDNG